MGKTIKAKNRPKIGQFDPVELIDAKRSADIVNRFKSERLYDNYIEVDLLNNTTRMTDLMQVYLAVPLCWEFVFDIYTIPIGMEYKHLKDEEFDQYELVYLHQVPSLIQDIKELPAIILHSFLDSGTNLFVAKVKIYPRFDNRFFDKYDDEPFTSVESGDVFDVKFEFDPSIPTNIELHYRKATSDPQDIRTLPNFKELLCLP